jgi:ABC-type glycerol-3-phosphate transport system permease component
MALPIIYLVSTAFKPLDELLLFPPRFLVRNPTFDNFTDLLLATSTSFVPFSRYIYNSAVVTVVSVFATIAISSLGAYPLAKDKTLPGRDAIFALIVAALMFAGEVTQIPRYLVILKAGLIDTYGALIIPGLASSYFLFLMRQFMEQVPDEIIEAARIDGASELKIFWDIVMPQCQNAWATIAIFSFINTWNDGGSSVLYTRSESMRTLPAAISTIGGGPGNIARAGAAAAAGFLQTMPVIIIYLLLQRRVIATMAYSGLKG